MSDDLPLSDDMPPPEASGETEGRLLGLPRTTVIGAVALGLAYGLLARLVFGWSALEGWIGVMSVTFIFVVPVVIGFVSVYTLRESRGWGAWLGVPITAALLTLVSAMLLAWEGLICIVVWGPIFFVLAATGGAIAGLTRRVSDRRHPLVLAGVAIVPFLLAPGEAALPAPIHTRVVENVIVIDASAEAVWDEIRDVAPISPEELGPSFAHRIGFPRPIAARLEGTGLGSVRHASFEGGVVFIETVTEWEPESALAFTISAEDVPPTTFDTHVAVGGPFFDVLDGRYVIEPLAPEADGGPRVRLRLASTHRLETRFNGYTRLWTDLFMRDIQQNILGVVKARAENDRVSDAT